MIEFLPEIRVRQISVEFHNSRGTFVTIFGSRQYQVQELRSCHVSILEEVHCPVLPLTLPGQPGNRRLPSKPLVALCILEPREGALLKGRRTIAAEPNRKDLPTFVR